MNTFTQTDLRLFHPATLLDRALFCLANSGFGIRASVSETKLDQVDSNKQSIERYLGMT